MSLSDSVIQTFTHWTLPVPRACPTGARRASAPLDVPVAQLSGWALSTLLLLARLASTEGDRGFQPWVHFP